MELTSVEQEQIAEQIKQGALRGRTDNEYGEHESKVIAHVGWELGYTKWED